MYHCEYLTPCVKQCVKSVCYSCAAYLHAELQRSQAAAVCTCFNTSANTHKRRLTHTQNNEHRQNIFCFGIRVMVLSLCNQLYPKIKIRLSPVTYFAVGHLQKLWESVKPTRHITVTEQYMPYSAFKSCFFFLPFLSLFVKLMPFKKNIRLHMYNVKYIFMYIIFIWMKLSNTFDLSV